MVEAFAELYPDDDWQRCVAHFYRDGFSHVPNSEVTEVAWMLKAIHAEEYRNAAVVKALDVVTRLRSLKLKTGADLVEPKVAETLAYYAYPSTPQHARRHGGGPGCAATGYG